MRKIADEAAPEGVDRPDAEVRVMQEHDVENHNVVDRLACTDLKCEKGTAAVIPGRFKTGGAALAVSMGLAVLFSVWAISMNEIVKNELGGLLARPSEAWILRKVGVLLSMVGQAYFGACMTFGTAGMLAVMATSCGIRFSTIGAIGGGAEGLVPVIAGDLWITRGIPESVAAIWTGVRSRRPLATFSVIQLICGLMGLLGLAIGGDAFQGPAIVGTVSSTRGYIKPEAFVASLENDIEKMNHTTVYEMLARAILVGDNHGYTVLLDKAPVNRTLEKVPPSQFVGYVAIGGVWLGVGPRPGSFRVDGDVDGVAAKYGRYSWVDERHPTLVGQVACGGAGGEAYETDMKSFLVAEQAFPVVVETQNGPVVHKCGVALAGGIHRAAGYSDDYGRVPLVGNWLEGNYAVSPRTVKRLIELVLSAGELNAHAAWARSYAMAALERHVGEASGRNFAFELLGILRRLLQQYSSEIGSPYKTQDQNGKPVPPTPKGPNVVETQVKASMNISELPAGRAAFGFGYFLVVIAIVVSGFTLASHWYYTPYLDILAMEAFGSASGMLRSVATGVHGGGSSLAHSCGKLVSGIGDEEAGLLYFGVYGRHVGLGTITGGEVVPGVKYCGLLGAGKTRVVVKNRVSQDVRLKFGIYRPLVSKPKYREKVSQEALKIYQSLWNITATIQDSEMRQQVFSLIASTAFEVLQRMRLNSSNMVLERGLAPRKLNNWMMSAKSKRIANMQILREQNIALVAHRMYVKMLFPAAWELVMAESVDCSFNEKVIEGAGNALYTAFLIERLMREF